jgi:hypothetical protein
MTADLVLSLNFQVGKELLELARDHDGIFEPGDVELVGPHVAHISSSHPTTGTVVGIDGVSGDIVLAWLRGPLPSNELARRRIRRPPRQSPNREPARETPLFFAFSFISPAFLRFKMSAKSWTWRPTYTGNCQL